MNQNNFIGRITAIGKSLESMEADIIARTKATITPDDQKAGTLIARTAQDASVLNTLHNRVQYTQRKMPLLQKNYTRNMLHCYCKKSRRSDKTCT